MLSTLIALLLKRLEHLIGVLIEERAHHRHVERVKTAADRLSDEQHTDPRIVESVYPRVLSHGQRRQAD